MQQLVKYDKCKSTQIAKKHVFCMNKQAEKHLVNVYDVNAKI